VLRPYELLDNKDHGYHRDAIRWLSQCFSAPFSVATGYVGLGGLDALADIVQSNPRPARLLLGAVPPPGLGTERDSESEPAVQDQFRASLQTLRHERDFQSFPPLRRETLERVAKWLEKDHTQVKRYTRRFLHGKAYIS
jgi:hypothetical protein